MSRAHVGSIEKGETTAERWLGIDFSGNLDMWTPGCRRSNVWVADIRKSKLRDDSFHLADLRRIQQLPGADAPFFRLAQLLSAREFATAAIDAPFSVPTALCLTADMV